MTLIPFDPREPQIVVYCNIGSNKKHNGFYKTKFVVDTGASFTVVSEEVLKLLDYDTASISRYRRLISVNEIMEVPILKIKSLWLGEEKVENLEVVCHTLPVEAKVEGLLGLDCLKRFNLKLYFDRGIIELHRIREG